MKTSFSSRKALALVALAPVASFAQTAPATGIDIQGSLTTLITKVNAVLPDYVTTLVDVGAFLLSVTLVFMAIRKVLGMIKGEAKSA